MEIQNNSFIISLDEAKHLVENDLFFNIKNKDDFNSLFSRLENFVVNNHINK